MTSFELFELFEHTLQTPPAFLPPSERATALIKVQYPGPRAILESGMCLGTLSIPAGRCVGTQPRALHAVKPFQLETPFVRGKVLAHGLGSQELLASPILIPG